MKKTSFIQLGLVTAALAYGISSMYVGVVDNQVQDDYNPVVVVNELPQVAQAIDDLKEELNNGVKDAKYLKEVKNIDVKEDVKMFTSMLIELEDVNKLIQKIKTKEKIEEMNKDLHQVNQEIKPIVDEVKKLESKDKKTLDMKKIVSLIKEQKQMAQSSSTNQTKLKI